MIKMKKFDVCEIIERFNVEIIANPEHNNEQYLRSFRDKVVEFWELGFMDFDEMKVLTMLIDRQLFIATGRA